MATGKKTLRFVLLAVFAIAAFVGWRLFGSNTGFSEKTKRFFVKTGSSFNEVMASLEEQQIVTNPGTFRWVAEKLGYDKNVKAGRYDIKKGASIFDIIRRLRSGRQTPVRLVINKLRTREDLAGKMGANFECDSSCFMEVLNNKEALREYGLDTNNVMTAIRIGAVLTLLALGTMIFRTWRQDRAKATPTGTDAATRPAVRR